MWLYLMDMKKRNAAERQEKCQENKSGGSRVSIWVAGDTQVSEVTNGMGDDGA